MNPIGHRPQSKRLLEQVREVLRYRHYRLKTEQAYLYWIRFFVRWQSRDAPVEAIRHPRDMGLAEVTQFLTMLATEQRRQRFKASGVGLCGGNWKFFHTTETKGYAASLRAAGYRLIADFFRWRALHRSYVAGQVCSANSIGGIQTIARAMTADTVEDR
jgi:hypothetical protein